MIVYLLHERHGGSVCSLGRNYLAFWSAQNMGVGVWVGVRVCVGARVLYNRQKVQVCMFLYKGIETHRP